MKGRYPKVVLDYLQANRDMDPLKIILGKSPFDGIANNELAAQIKGRKIAKKKYPFLQKYLHYRFPVSISLEQSSSELTAKYKSKLVSGNLGADLTGGMGIDSYFLAKKFQDFHYVELDAELCSLARYNFAELDIKKIKVIHSSAEDFLALNTQTYDVIYLDPSRRIGGQKRTSVRNLQPNIVTLQDQLKAAAEVVMIKLSPMQDIADVLQEIDDVHEVHVISVDHEVKELLILIRKTTVNEVSISAVNLSTSNTTTSYSSNMSLVHQKMVAGSLGCYLYQPHPTLVKAGLQNAYAWEHGLIKLHSNTQLFSSDTLVENFFGRIFSIEQDIALNKKGIAKVLPEKKANIISKNHPLSPAEIAKKLQLKEGGNKYLIATKLFDESLKALLCSRIK